MKKSVLLASAAIMMCYFTSCSGGKKTEEAAAPAEEAKTEAAVPEYKLMNDLPTVDLSTFPKDADGKVTLFDGKSFNGWRGYGRTDVPAAWEVVDGTIHIKGSGAVKLVLKMVATWFSLTNSKTMNLNSNGK